MQEVTVKQRDMRLLGRCFGTAVLGPRGQLVVPVEARKELGIDAGNKFLVFGHFQELGLILIKVEAAERVLDAISTQLDEVARLVRESKSGKVRTKAKGNPT
jgi:bifunctional DNA-binding transcriptional regulator/antitoxin component of YhaV-PrlF toxin-antitoxin module